MSWQRPATPLSCRQNQALAAGSETGRRLWTGASAHGIVPAPAIAGPTSADRWIPLRERGLVLLVWQRHLGGGVSPNNKHFSIWSMVSAPDAVLNPSALISKEQSKVTKHGPSYAPLGFSFLPYAAFCFGGLGPAAIWFLFVLADYELTQHDYWLVQQGLDPLVKSTSARRPAPNIASIAAFAKVLLALPMPSPSSPSCVSWESWPLIPSPPGVIPTLPYRDLLAQNSPDPADPFFSFLSHFSPDPLVSSCSFPLSSAGAQCLPEGPPYILPFHSGSALFYL